jgi:hypothetical protein
VLPSTESWIVRIWRAVTVREGVKIKVKVVGFFKGRFREGGNNWIFDSLHYESIKNRNGYQPILPGHGGLRCGSFNSKNKWESTYLMRIAQVPVCVAFGLAA